MRPNCFFKGKNRFTVAYFFGCNLVCRFNQLFFPRPRFSLWILVNNDNCYNGIVCKNYIKQGCWLAMAIELYKHFYPY